jgi:hypothetical protein
MHLLIIKTETKLRGLRPRANYIDQATASWSAKLVPILRKEGATC